MRRWPQRPALQVATKLFESSLSWVTQCPSLRNLLASQPSGLAPAGHYPSGLSEITHGHAARGASPPTRSQDQRADGVSDTGLRTGVAVGRGGGIRSCEGCSARPPAAAVEGGAGRAIRAPAVVLRQGDVPLRPSRRAITVPSYGRCAAIGGQRKAREALAQ